MEKKKKIGKILRVWAIQNDKSVKDIATMLCCSTAFYSRVERGVDPIPLSWLENAPVELKKEIGKEIKICHRKKYESVCEFVANHLKTKGE